MTFTDAKKIGTDQVELLLSCLKNNKKIAESTLFRTVEKKVPFEVNEEKFQKVAQQVLERAKRISEELKRNPVAAVKNIKQLILEPVAVKKAAAVKTAAKKATKATKTAKKAVKKAIH